MMDGREHWETVYRTKAPDALSWYQRSADRSLDMIRHAASAPHVPVIDVGGGASVLVDDLVGAGYQHVTVLDLAGSALAAARARLGEASSRVTWLEADVRTAELPAAHYAVWHDRALFHFLTHPADRAAYVARVRRAVRAGGSAIIATFAEDGPTRCSGLPVVRYAPEELHRQFGSGFELIATEREAHATPTGSAQAFVYCLMLWTGD